MTTEPPGCGTTPSRTAPLDGTLELWQGSTPTTLLGQWVGITGACKLTWQVQGSAGVGGPGSATARTTSTCGTVTYDITITTTDGKNATMTAAYDESIGCMGGTPGTITMSGEGSATKTSDTADGACSLLATCCPPKTSTGTCPDAVAAADEKKCETMLVDQVAAGSCK